LREPVDIFKKGGGQKLADELGIRFLGRIPVDPRIVDTGDAGKPLIAAYPESVTAKAFEELVRNIIVATEEMRKDILEEKFMRIAIPISTPSKIETDPEKFELFALYDVENNKILVKDVVKKAENQGLIDFLKEQVVTHVLLFDPPKELADFLSHNEIKVLVTDTSTETPDNLIEEYLKEKQLH
jgi:hypothetical protein